MTIINKLASSLDRRDQLPNQELASEILASRNKKAVRELVENLSNKKAIQNDCIKVLYEVGALDPALIADYIPEYLAALESKNNRLQWGAMTALCAVVDVKPKEIYDALTSILAAMDKGSVITKDNGVQILIKLCAIQQYSAQVFPLLIEQLLKSPTNQLPMYAERAVPIIKDPNKVLFVKTLTSRLGDIEKDSKRARIEKVIRKFC